MRRRADGGARGRGESAILPGHADVAPADPTIANQLCRHEADRVARSAVETVVPVDVRVTATDGTAVTNLKASDFLLSEDGVRQEIRAFSTRAVTPDSSAIDPANDARVAIHFVEVGGLTSAPRTGLARGLGLILSRSDLLQLALGTAGSASRESVPQAVTIGAAPLALRIPLQPGFGDIKNATVIVYDATADLLGSQIVTVGRSK
jgi:hypothetical protein